MILTILRDLTVGGESLGLELSKMPVSRYSAELKVVLTIVIVILGWLIAITVPENGHGRNRSSFSLLTKKSANPSKEGAGVFCVDGDEAFGYLPPRIFSKSPYALQALLERPGRRGFSRPLERGDSPASPINPELSEKGKPVPLAEETKKKGIIGTVSANDSDYQNLWGDQPVKKGADEDILLADFDLHKESDAIDKNATPSGGETSEGTENLPVNWKEELAIETTPPTGD